MNDTHRSWTTRAVWPLGAFALCALALAGCSTPAQPSGPRVTMSDEEQLAADMAFTQRPFDDQARAGVIRQRTLFEHHFEPGSAQLTSLGRRDLGMLADAMSSTGGSISVQRASASKDLYAARLETVRDALVARGIPTDRVKLDGQPAGGTGVATSHAVEIRAQIRDEATRAQKAGISSGISDTRPSGGKS